VSRSIKVLSKFIEEFEGLRGKSGQKKVKQEAMVELKINNQVSSTMGPKRFDLTLSIDATTIEMVMNQLA
jgi:hypothetical protein